MQNSHMNHTKPTYSPLKSPGNRTRLFNGVTSTPLSSQNAHLKSSLFLRNKLTPLQSPPLYNLSETSNSNKSPAPIQNISGPLLASTKFNVSLGTYTDTKSPGLTNRIVQYDNEAKQMLAPTHQAKYGSPGLFPIVHFFKQDIPTISPKPKKVTVKIASPDASWYNNTEYNTKNIGNRNANVQNGPNITQTNADTETRSVLDALKEISRKRIHTTSDFDIEQDVCKRQKRSEKVLNPSETNKRVREEDLAATDLQGKTSGPPPAKKICVVDMLAASYTSSRLYKEKLEKGLKKKTEVDMIDRIDPKPRKLLTIGTQTADRLDKVEKSKDIEVEMTDCTALKSSDPIVKEKESKPLVKPTEPPRSNLIFDEKRLEISRKNRLATLLSALTGEPPQYIQYEKSKSATESENGTPTNSPIKLVSILSPQNKPKHDKHVTFNLPPEQKEITSITSSTSSTAVTTTTMELLPPAQTVSTPSKDLITSSIETPKSAASAPMGIKLNFETNTSTTKEVVKVEETKASESNLGGIAFKTSATTLATTTVSSPFGFGLPTSVSSSNIISSMPTTSVTTISKEPSSPQKSGGFKFDLGKCPSSATKTTTDVNLSTMIPKFNFNTTSSGQTESSSVTKSISLPGFCMPQSTSVVTPTFTFGDNQSKPSSVQVNDTAIAIIPADKKAGFGDVKFGNVTSPLSVNPVSSAVSMQSPQLSTAIVTTNPTNLFAFTAAKQPALPSTQTTQSSNTATTFGGFGALPAIAPSTQSPAFGIATSAVPTFGVDFSNTAPTSTNTSFGAFGTSTTTAAAPSFVPTTTTSMFGNPTPTIPSFTSPGLVTSTIPTFATPTTTEKMFNPGTTSSGLFVTNPASQSFNATTTTTTASSGMFGTAPESKPFSFGSNQSNVGGDSSFNTPNTKSGFNFTNNTTPSSTSLKPVSSFGSPNVFGSTAPNANIGSNVFKSPSASNFGSAQFGSKTENAAFGSKVENQNTFGSFNNSFGTSTNAAGGFGANASNNNNNNANTFGTPANTAGGFGTNTNNNNNSTNNVNTFGTPTNSAGGFGTNTNSNNNNNNTNAFGANTANTTFGANSSAFGTNPTNKAFGTNTNPTFPITQNPASGFTSPQNNFGQAAQNTNTFGAPPPTNNANNSTFSGANIFGNAAASNTSNFGFTGGDSASAFSKPAAGAFGGATAAGDTAFQFGGGNAPATNQGFAGNATNAPPSGGQSNVFAFGSPSQPAAPTGGVFTFGTADAKPAFNFSAGSNAAPSFGAGAANFNPAPAQNAFNPPQFGGAVAGVFSIGSGSTSGPRNRNQLKGKRRV